MRTTLVLVVFSVGGALAGCVRPPPPPLALHKPPTYRAEPAASPSQVATPAQPARPALPLPVPPEPVSAAAAAPCPPAGPGNLPEARKEQLFKEFSQLENRNQNPATAAAAALPSPGKPAASACGPAP